MLSKVIASDKSYDLVYYPSDKVIFLVNKSSNQKCLKAKYFFDTSDGATLLSDFQYLLENSNQNDLVLLTANLVSEFLSKTKDKCKLFCCPGKYRTEFLNNENYRASNIDRLMLRESAKINKNSTVFLNDISIGRLSLASPLEMTQIQQLLKQTYWADTADEDYIIKAIKNSIFLVARDLNTNIVGLVRCISNGHFAYISDMVVNKEHRKQHIATLLLQSLCMLIDIGHEFTALISAREGDGKDASQKLYGEKFGFIEYNNSHSNEIFFRYIKMTPPSLVDVFPDGMQLHVLSFLDLKSLKKIPLVCKKWATLVNDINNEEFWFENLKRMYGESYKTWEDYISLANDDYSLACQLSGDDMDDDCEIYKTWDDYRKISEDDRPWKTIVYEEDKKLTEAVTKLNNFLNKKISEEFLNQLEDRQNDYDYLEARSKELVEIFSPVSPYAVIKRYIEMGFNINAVDDTDLPLAAHIIFYNANLALSALLNAGLNPNLTFYDDTTLLLCAAMTHCNKRIMSVLIDHGADVNCRLESGDETPLAFAIANMDPEVVELLLSKGAKINEYCELRDYPLDAAIKAWDKCYTEKYSDMTADVIYQFKVNNIFFAPRELPNDDDFLTEVSNFQKVIDLLIEYGANTENYPWLPQKERVLEEKPHKNKRHLEVDEQDEDKRPRLS